MIEVNGTSSLKSKGFPLRFLDRLWCSIAGWIAVSSVKINLMAVGEVQVIFHERDADFS